MLAEIADSAENPAWRGALLQSAGYYLDAKPRVQQAVPPFTERWRFQRQFIYDLSIYNLVILILPFTIIRIRVIRVHKKNPLNPSNPCSEFKRTWIARILRIRNSQILIYILKIAKWLNK